VPARGAALKPLYVLFYLIYVRSHFRASREAGQNCGASNRSTVIGEVPTYVPEHAIERHTSAISASILIDKPLTTEAHPQPFADALRIA
jgi:hypothetical protein